jgi:regulator of protease activity HflC (stomatin/prohibitin superfamily)
MRAYAGAARREVVRHPLEDVDFPSEVVQQIRRKKAAERSADDNRTRAQGLSARYKKGRLMSIR